MPVVRRLVAFDLSFALGRLHHLTRLKVTPDRVSASKVDQTSLRASSSAAMVCVSYFAALSTQG